MGASGFTPSATTQAKVVSDRFWEAYAKALGAKVEPASLVPYAGDTVSYSEDIVARVESAAPVAEPPASDLERRIGGLDFFGSSES